MDYQNILNDLLTNLVHEEASDLHLGVGRRPAIRINGQLITLITKEVMSEDVVLGLLNIFVGSDRVNKFKEEKELDFSYTFAGNTNLRGNAYVARSKICIALRLIPKAKSFAELNLPAILETFSRKKQGFFLVVGPVGQGKSTTLSTMINLINHEQETHIITIEDPIEFIYEPDKAIIDQREVGIDTKEFIGALKETLREDANVILIGEMRSPDTMAAAVTAAETGHFVLSTLHTNNAAQTIDRIIDSFPAGQQEQIRLQLASSLLGVFSQRLIPRISGGRVPAYELLINNSSVANMIREKRTYEINTVIETSSGDGMVDMNRSLVELVQKGEITIENAYQYSINPKGLERMM
jgi:twitching motility protein PilT